MATARWYLIASLLIALTFGATLGALALATRTLPLDLLAGLGLERARLAHGYAQIFGFAALFVMGVALHVVPRFKGVPLASGALVLPTFWLQLAGAAACIAGALADSALLRSAGAASATAGACCFGLVVHRTLAAGPATEQHLEPHLRAGCLWLVATALLAVAAAAASSPALQAAVWEAAIWGFAASWIFGMSLRIVPAHLGLQPMRARDADRLFLAYQTAAILWVLAAVGEAWTALPGSRFLAGAALAAAGLAFALRFGMLPRRPGGPPAEAAFQAFVVSAYGWLVAALCLGPGAASAALLLGQPYDSLLGDFARHAFALGFLTQMIMAVALRVVPLFAGARLWSERLRAALVLLLNGAVALRGLQVLVALGADAAWPWIALSGVVGLAAFLAFTLNLVMSLRQRAPAVA